MVDVAQLVEPRIVIPVVAGSSPVIHPIFGPLAQLVEHLTLNQLVLGSIPRRPTNKIKHLDVESKHYLKLFILLECNWSAKLKYIELSRRINFYWFMS